jgi:hypothetical protein
MLDFSVKPNADPKVGCDFASNLKLSLGTVDAICGLNCHQNQLNGTTKHETVKEFVIPVANNRNDEFKGLRSL